MTKKLQHLKYWIVINEQAVRFEMNTEVKCWIDNRKERSIEINFEQRKHFRISK